MDEHELDRLLGGARGVALQMQSGAVLRLDRHELADPVAWRAAMRRQLGHTGYRPPVYDQDRHDEIVRVVFRLVDMLDDERRAA